MPLVPLGPLPSLLPLSLAEGSPLPMAEEMEEGTEDDPIRQREGAEEIKEVLEKGMREGREGETSGVKGKVKGEGETNGKEV
jgi:hypothetical protein